MDVENASILLNFFSFNSAVRFLKSKEYDKVAKAELVKSSPNLNKYT